MKDPKHAKVEDRVSNVVWTLDWRNGNDIGEAALGGNGIRTNIWLSGPWRSGRAKASSRNCPH